MFSMTVSLNNKCQIQNYDNSPNKNNSGFIVGFLTTVGPRYTYTELQKHA